MTEKMCSVIKEEGKKKKVSENEVDREIDELREEVKEVLRETKDRNYTTNLKRGKEKGKNDNKKVFLPADKRRIMVAMDRYESIGDEESYEYKMKQVLVDLKAKPSIRAGED